MRTENIVIGARSLVRDSLCVNGKGSQRVMRAKVIGARSLVRDSLCVNGKGSQRVMRAEVLRIATFT
jgi:hypothetical protein